MYKYFLYVFIMLSVFFLPGVCLAQVDIGVHLGNSPTAAAVRNYEKMTGRHVKSVSIYYSLNPAMYPPFDTDRYKQIRYHDGYDTHTIMHIVFEPWVSLSDISSGDYDSYFRSYATAAKNWGDEIRFRFGHEMIQDDNPNTKGWYSWQDQPGAYKDAFRHVYTIFHSQGADNVKFVWCPNYHISDVSILKKYYPGKQYVDWIGMDGWGSRTESFDAVFWKLYEAIVKHPEIFGDKNIMIGEFATAEGKYKAQWIQDAFNKIKTKYPKIKAFYWFNLNKEHDWRVNSSPEALEAFRKAMQDPYFLSHVKKSSASDQGSGDKDKDSSMSMARSIPIRIHIPIVNALFVGISRINSETGRWVSVESMDFGTLEFDNKYHIFRSKIYFAVDVGIVTNQGNWQITHMVSPITNGVDVLDRNINVVFISVENGKEHQLAKTSYKNSDGLEFGPSKLHEKWLRIYYGFATGKDDAPGVKPLSLDKTPGNYVGTVTLTLVVP